MSEYSKILSACGWIEGSEELPLVAERIARHSAKRIEKLTTALEEIQIPIGWQAARDIAEKALESREE